MNILALDDREDGRYYLRALLEGHGNTVECAGNGEEALALLRVRPFDLIISDILMPVMDGFQFCRAVKSDEALRGIPFLFYTATYTGPQDEEFALKLGADRFLRKPCDPDEIMAAIRGVTSAPARDAASLPPPLPQEEVLRLYSERLVRKVEQKMLEAERDAKALETEKRKFQSLVDGMPLGVLLLDGAGRFLYVNPRFTELFGYAQGEFPDLGSLLDAAFPDADARATVAASWSRLRVRTHEAPAERINVPLRTRDGAERHVRIQAILLAEGNPLMTWEDVTEHVLLETNLRQAQKMEAIATLAGGIAHDFNNILSAIIGFAQLVQSDHLPSCPSTQNADEILTAAERARRLIRQMLTFSRRTEQERAPVALHEVGKEVLGMLRATLPATIQVREEMDAEAVILADATQMHQMLMNLCTNAFHAMKSDGGTLEVTMRRRTLSAREAERLHAARPGPHLHLRVRDTGCGMAPETVARIFDPYFTTHPESEGTGLGLSVTHGIVKSHHGTIFAESSPGRGTTFHVYLPIAGEDAGTT